MTNRVVECVCLLGALSLFQGEAPATAPTRYPWPFAPMDEPGRVLSAYQNPLRAELPSAYFHGGVDIHARPGSAVLAIAAGAVEVYSDGRYDNVVLTEESGDVWEYRHLVADSVPETVRERGAVAVGDVLGASPRWGATGYDHIHLNRRRRDGAILDPLDHLLPLADTLPPVIEAILVLPDGGHAPYAPGEDGAVEVAGALDFAVVAMDRCRPGDFQHAPIAIEWSVGEGPARRFAPCAGRLPEPARLPVPRYPMAGLRDAYLAAGALRSRNPTYTPEGQRYVSLVTHADERGALDPDGSFDTRLLADGTYPLRVTAADHAGNRAERVVLLRVRNDDPPRAPEQLPLSFDDPAADDYRIAFAGASLRHRFRVPNRTGRDLELRGARPARGSGEVLDWTRRVPAGGVLEVEVRTPPADWRGDVRTLRYVVETADAHLALQLRLEAHRH